MKVISTTDNKYLGEEIASNVKVGDNISINDVSINIQFIFTLENGNICIGNTNYQLECKE
jgi:hypothetical protein